MNSQLSTIYYLIEEILKYLLTDSGRLSLSQKEENRLVVPLDLTVFETTSGSNISEVLYQKITSDISFYRALSALSTDI